MSNKHPPIKNRFRRGVSGNPGGRPKGRKGSPDFSEALYRVLSRKVEITDNNKSRKVYFAEVMILNLAKLAVRGDSKAVFALVKLLDWFPVNREHSRDAEMKANAEKTRQKLRQMIENREKTEADERDEVFASLFGRKRMRLFRA
jgi:hypothetical protein